MERGQRNFAPTLAWMIVAFAMFGSVAAGQAVPV